MKRRLFCLIAVLAFTVAVVAPAMAENPRVVLTTNLGDITVELNTTRAPKTTANFLAYVKAGHYDGTIFHRVIKGFMIQGGGFQPGMRKKPSEATIRNEADNGLSNLTRTIAMARTGDPHSASAQFFINTNDNYALDHKSKTRRGWGYAVFGKVVAGMEVVREIEAQATASAGPYRDVPRRDIVIQKARAL
jgi:cyclophilin family peptidyl-prolyl cis-trans isomerase